MIEDVTEQVQLAQQEAEQRELLAVFQGFARDRLALLAFFEQTEQLSPSWRRRLPTPRSSGGCCTP